MYTILRRDKIGIDLQKGDLAKAIAKKTHYFKNGELIEFTGEKEFSKEDGGVIYYFRSVESGIIQKLIEREFVLEQ